MESDRWLYRFDSACVCVSALVCICLFLGLSHTACVSFLPFRCSVWAHECLCWVWAHTCVFVFVYLLVYRLSCLSTCLHLFVCVYVCPWKQSKDIRYIVRVQQSIVLQHLLWKICDTLKKRKNVASASKRAVTSSFIFLSEKNETCFWSLLSIS